MNCITNFLYEIDSLHHEKFYSKFFVPPDKLFIKEGAVVPVTGWSGRVSVKNKVQIWTLEGMKSIEEKFPYPVRGIHSDNDLAFINAHFSRYCAERGIEFSRPGRRNEFYKPHG